MENGKLWDERLPLSSFTINPGADHNLTFRELKCINYLLCDYTIKEIAENISTSERGVYKVLQRLLFRLSINSYQGLAGWALHHRILLVSHTASFHLALAYPAPPLHSAT